MSDHTRAVARYDGPRTTADLQVYAQTLAVNTAPDGRTWRNDALPAIFRGNPAAVAFAVEYAKALDVSPITAIIGIHIIDGKPTASAGLISALVRRAGHKIRTWTEGSIDEGTFKAFTTIVREDDPEFTYRSEWTLGRAVRAGLMRRTEDGRIVAAKDKSAWATYPENMCKSRTITECARDAAEDAILGVHYTPEELGVDVDDAGDPVYTVTQVPHNGNGSGGDRAEGTPEQTPAAAAPKGNDHPAPEATSAAADQDDPAAEERRQRALDAAVETVRRSIFDARTEEDLRAAWSAAGATFDPLMGGVSYSFRDMVTADADDVETNLLDLFAVATSAIKAGSYLAKGTRYDDGPDSGSPAETTGAGDSGPQNGTQDPADDASPTGDDARRGVTDEPTDPTDAGGDPNVEDAHVVEDNPMRAAVDQIMRELDSDAIQAVVSWCRQESVNPNQGEAACALIVDAIRSGEALPVSFPVDPETLVQELLGGELVERIPHRTTEERHAAAEANRRAVAVEENREDAAAARPAGGRPPKGAGLEEYRRTRDQINPNN